MPPQIDTVNVSEPLVPLGKGLFCELTAYARIVEIVTDSDLRRQQGERGYSISEIAEKSEQPEYIVRAVIGKIRHDDRKIQKELGKIEGLISDCLTSPPGGDFPANRGPNGDQLRPKPHTLAAERADRRRERERQRILKMKLKASPVPA